MYVKKEISTKRRTRKEVQGKETDKTGNKKWNPQKKSTDTQELVSNYKLSQ